MAQAKLLILVANLVLVRLALATSIEINLHQASDNQKPDDRQQHSSASILDGINSLDYAANASLANTEPQVQHMAGDLQANHQEAVYPHKDPLPRSSAMNLNSRRVAKSASMRRQQQQQQPSLPQTIISLLGQLEKVDVKRIIADSLKQIEGRSSGTRHPSPAATNQTSKAKERVIGAGSLAADTGNLFSIGKQLVKLARSQVGSDFNSWLSPMMAAPSFLSGASHFGDSLGDFGSTAASAKSDWFWLVVPAVIVVGAGVIVIPLIAAWLVSNVMSQNTFTVSAGRRRRRDVSSVSAAGQPHNDLLKLLDIHQVLDEPQWLVEKLARFHKALESVGTRSLQAALDKHKES